MKNKLILITIFLLLFFLMELAKTWAFSSRDSYLWIEFEEPVKEKDGSLTLPLQINYGRFPDEKKEIWGLDGLRAFYTLNEKTDEGKRIFYEAKIRKDKTKWVVNINSHKANCFLVMVEAKKKLGEVTYWYLAKTSFILFGHAFSKSGRIRPISSNEINRQLEIYITPQFQCWPQTGDPVKITPLFNKDYLAQKVIYLFDENMPLRDIMTDEKGNCIYVPPKDKKLNSKGETAFKQTIIVAEETKGNIKYISSYALLLHRSRSKNRKLFIGAVIFLGTMISVFLFVIIKRKRFDFETL